MPKINRASLVTQETSFAAALESQVPTASFVADGSGRKVTSAQMQASVATHLGLLARIALVRTQLHDMVMSARAMATGIAADQVIVKAYVIATCGIGSPQYQAFGYSTRKRTPPTTETLANAVVKMRATRSARGTKGKRQKAAIHGTPALADQRA